MTDRERLLQILNVAIFPHEGADPLEAVTDYLLDNGVTFAKDTNVPTNPVIPGHDDQYNIAEMSYNNGYAKGLEDGKQKWIPASEPPQVWRDENGDAINFLIFTPNIGIDIGNWIEPMNMWFCLGVPFKVTHWMELPEPPKEDTVKP